MSDFKWHKETFMSRLYNLTTCRYVVWKHKNVEGLPKYVKERFYSTMEISILQFKRCAWKSVNNRNMLPRLQKTQIIKENWDLLTSNMELPKLLLLEKIFDPRRSSVGVGRVNQIGTLTARESTTTKVRTSRNFLKKIPLVSNAIKGSLCKSMPRFQTN